jgi:hypothetical protein
MSTSITTNRKSFSSAQNHGKSEKGYKLLSSNSGMRNAEGKYTNLFGNILKKTVKTHISELIYDLLKK